MPCWLAEFELSGRQGTKFREGTVEQPITATAAEKEFAQARTALASDDTLTALYYVERALKLRDHPG